MEHANWNLSLDLFINKTLWLRNSYELLAAVTFVVV